MAVNELDGGLHTLTKPLPAVFKDALGVSGQESWAVAD